MVIAMGTYSAEKVILLVEDNEDDVFLAETAIKSAGVKNRVIVARDGQQAINYLSGNGEFGDRQRFPFPALVLLDLKLPYRNGAEVLAWINERADTVSTAVVILTSSDEPRDWLDAYTLGAKTYLIKPPTAQMIREVAASSGLADFPG